MKRILVFGITDNPGGVESVIMNYYRHVDRKKIQFDFLCNTKEVAYEKEIMSLGGNIYRITARSKNRKQYKKDMECFFKKNSHKYNTIWVNVCSLANIDYLKYAKKHGIKYRIIHSHNSQNMDSKLRNLLHKFNRLFIKNYATDFWSCSELAGKWFYNKKIINSNKYLIINNAIETNKYKYSEKARKEYRKILGIDDKLVIGNVGRLHFQKNQDFLIDIFFEIQKKKENSVLLIIGEGTDREKLLNKVNKLGITDKVKFLGLRNDVEKLIQAMDFFVFPSVFEGLPVILIEAQTSNLNIIASDTITQEVKINPNFEFFSLKESPKKWANEIINKSFKFNRNDDISLIIKKGYDIEFETNKIETYFRR